MSIPDSGAVPLPPAADPEMVLVTEPRIAVLRAPHAAPRAWRLLHELRWKLVIARLVVSYVAVIATVAIFPGITIRGNFWVWTPVLAAVFGLLNGFVKPALQVLTIRYLFLSYGLILVLINMVTFWLLDVLTERLDVHDFFDLLGGSIVLGLLVTLLENLVGIAAPVVDTRPMVAAAED